MTAPTQTGTTPSCDVFIVGGGINGAGIARDLAGRGWRVVLCEKDDLASHTSSSSTKLIHGGLRYLEYYEFSLVRKALPSARCCCKSAPHIMWPLRFVMPHDPAMRPAWMIRVGLFLYDHLARREVLPGSRTRRPAPPRRPARRCKPSFTRGFVYSDGWVDDARLVVLNAIDARERGATVLTRTRCVDARRGADGWRPRCEAPPASSAHGARARRSSTPPARGPAQFLRRAGAPAASAQDACGWSRAATSSCRSCSTHDHAYIFQNPDKRIIFAIPYERDFTLIGTTDVEHHGPIGAAPHRRRRDRLPVRAGQPLFRAARSRRPTWSGPIPACARCSTTSRATRRP